MRNKIIALILLYAVTLSLFTACGKNNNNATTIEGRTLFIYMCGSNLETKQGLASKSIDELLSAGAGDMNIVIQTGGASKWRHHDISADKTQRYEIKDGKLKLLKEFEQKNMGEAQTLTDFLKWGQEQYPTDRNMLVLWDHGGGSVKGVCFDENYNFDALTLTELNTALKKAKLNNKFDIIGFDACMMASIETAATVKDFADYMVASEGIEPAGGWDYKALCKAYASKNTPLKTGKAICDSYMKKCKRNEKDRFSTLSVFDLSLTEKMLVKFERVINIIKSSLYDKASSPKIIYALNFCEKFGGNDSFQGGSNMLDLIDIFNKTPDLDMNLTDIWEAVDKFAPYNVRGENRNVHGVSFYYPIFYDGREIRDYIALGLSKKYNSFLEEFYLNLPDQTVEYTDRGSLSKNGAFNVALDPSSSSYLSSVDYILTTTDENGKQHKILTDNNIIRDQEKMTYQSDFKGMCLALNGHRMYYKTVKRSESFVDYSTPVIVNGKHTTLHYSYDCYSDDSENGYYQIFGIWNGYDEDGLPDNEIKPLKNGDKVQVVTDYLQENGKEKEQFSEEFTIGKNGGIISEIPLDDKEYQYVFVATDVFGNTFKSDTATFEKKGGSYKAVKAEPSSSDYIIE